MRTALPVIAYFVLLPIGFAILYGGLVALFAPANPNITPHGASLAGLIFGTGLGIAALGSWWLRGR